MNYKGVKIPEPKNFVFRFEYEITEKSKVEALEELKSEPIMVKAEDFKFVGTKKPSKQDKDLYYFSKKDFIEYRIAHKRANKKRGKKN